MNKNIGTVVGIITIIVIVGGIYLSMNRAGDSKMMENKIGTSAMVEQKESTMMKDDKAIKSDTMIKVGSYEAYASEKIAKAAAMGNVVLFFRASWCPTCRGLDADIKAHLKDVPGNLTILDVDYDNSTELKKKYGVTYQHTMIQVDKNGSMIKKWMGSPTLVAFVAELK